MNSRIARDFKLHDYQQQVVDYCLDIPNLNDPTAETRAMKDPAMRWRCGLFLNMGLGKSRIALAVMACLNLPTHILVIAPTSIARSSWIEEINKISKDIGAPQPIFKYTSFLIDRKGKQLTRNQRHALYEMSKTSTPQIYFLNRELVCDLVDYFSDAKGHVPPGTWPFRFIVCDEFQSFKSPTSKRFKAMKKIIDQTDAFLGLTGTPAPNSLLDLWSQIYLLDGGKRLGTTMTQYKNEYFYSTKFINGRPVDWIPREHAKEAIYYYIKDIVISMDNSVLTLPDVIYDNMYAYMDPDETKLYNAFKKDSVLVAGTGNPDDDIVASNAAVLVSKLAQLASGNIYTDKDGNFQNFHYRKNEVLRYIYDNEPDNLLVAYYFRTDLINIKKEFPDAVVFDGSGEMLKEWNDGKIRMLLVQPASSGFGLNFQFGGHTLVWYTLTWNLEQYLQMNARLYRQGQTQTVVIHHILTKNTIDERILQKLNMKDTSEKALLDAVRVTLDSNNDEDDDFGAYTPYII